MIFWRILRLLALAGEAPVDELQRNDLRKWLSGMTCKIRV